MERQLSRKVRTNEMELWKNTRAWCAAICSNPKIFKHTQFYVLLTGRLWLNQVKCTDICKEFFFQPCCQEKRLSANVSTNHWYVHICTCHRTTDYIDISTTLYVTCLWPARNISLRGCWWSYRWRGCQASEQSLGLCFNICKRETTEYFSRRPSGEFSSLSFW